jgi:hypothetical protein
MTQNGYNQKREYANQMCKRKKREWVTNRIREIEEETGKMKHGNVVKK